MKRNHKVAIKLALAIAAALFVGLFLVPRSSVLRAAEGHVRVPLTSDWSHRHMIYSAPRSLSQAMQLQYQPRFVQQHYRHGGRGNVGWHNPFRNNHGDPIAGDWAVDLGSGSNGTTAVSIGAGEYAAKYSFDVDSPVTAANCPTDFVVYNTSAASSTAAAATGTVTIGSEPNAGDTIVIDGPGAATTYQFETTTTGCTTGRCVARSASTATTAANLKNAIAGTCFNTCTGGAGVNDPNVTAATNVINSSELNLTSVALGIGGNVTITSSSGTREAHTGMAGGTNSQASIVAVDNLYVASCGTPSLRWAYNLGATHTAQTSAVLSIDGTQVAFVQTSTTAGAAILSVLRPHTGDGTSYTGVTTDAANITATTTPATYVTCKSGATSCLLNLTFAGTGTHPDSNSAPFYDYINDVLYVGDDVGAVHKFINVFNGTPSEQQSGGWPATTDTTTGKVLTAPIYDGVSGLVIVADARTSNTGTAGTHGGRVYSISSTGTVVASVQLADTPGFQDAPVVDGAAGKIYAFATLDTGGSNTGIFQLPVNFTASTTAVEATAGTGSASRTVFAGDFDQAYYDSETAGSSQTPTGHLYVCGHTSSTPQLYRINISADTMTAGAGTAGPTLSASTTSCSPITEIDSGTNGFAFVSVATESFFGAPTHCTTNTGCLMSFDLNATFGTSLAPSAGIAESGGTSGIIIDNLSTGGGAAQVYFSQLTNKACNSGAATSGCAIQASQAGLN